MLTVLDVDVDVDVDVGTDDVVEADGALELGLELDFGLVFGAGWDVVAEVELGMVVPLQPAITTSPVNPRPTINAARGRRTRTPPPHTPTTGYASTVRSSSRPAKRRCASARRVGMCSEGTSCATYPFKTRRATV